MAETVTIQSAIKKKASNNNDYQAVTLTDGRTATAWGDDFTPYINQEVLVDIFKDNKGFYKIELPKPEVETAPVVTPQSKTVSVSQKAVVENLVKALIDFVNLFK